MPVDGLYTKMISRVSYKTLVVIPPLLSILAILFVMWNGIEYGIDFKGGTWMEVLTSKDITAEHTSLLSAELTKTGLADVKVYSGFDIDSSLTKLTMVTTSVVNESQVKEIITKYSGEIIESDYALVPLPEKPPADLADKLAKRFGGYVNVDYDDGVMKVTALDLNEEKLDSALEYYLKQPLTTQVSKKNFNVRSVGPTLGKTFREQGVKALIVAYILMGLVIFMAFKDVVPSFAVMLAATCDAAIALGGMVALGIPLEPSSLAALLMLIGYSVDSDILLTARTIKQKMGEVNERIDSAMKTGLTMTGTTLGVMLMLIIVSKTLTQIDTLYNIGVVLLLGLVADLMTTWFTNAGILKWYLESPRGRKMRFRR